MKLWKKNFFLSKKQKNILGQEETEFSTVFKRLRFYLILILKIMLKSILNLNGTQQLTNDEQKKINGGKPVWCGMCQCTPYSTAIPACGISMSAACESACANG